MAHANHNVVDAMMQLFPDGPPEELRELIMGLELDGYSAKDIVVVNTDTQFRTVFPHGTEINANRKGAIWAVSITSPPSPRGSRLTWLRDVPGDKVAAMVYVGEIACDMMEITTRLQALFDRWEQHRLNDGLVASDFAPMLTAYTAENELAFDLFYKAIGSHGMKNQMFKMDFLGLPPDNAASRPVFAQGPEIRILCAIAVHELWISKWQKQFTEELAMAKNSPGQVWWCFTGGDKGIRNITTALNHNRHYMVLDTKTQIFLRIQGSEDKFVAGLAESHNCRAKAVDEPKHLDTLCGKQSTTQSIAAHQRRCNACGRVRTNVRSKDATSSNVLAPPAEVEAVVEAVAEIITDTVRVEEAPEISGPQVISSTDPRSGPAITVQGPSEHQPDDYTSLAADNRRTADELMGQAEYYMQIADYYEAMLKPTDAVAEAEALLRKAQEGEQADRDRQKIELDALIANGPPA